jgi:uncharacterized protein YukE
MKTLLLDPADDLTQGGGGAAAATPPATPSLDPDVLRDALRDVMQETLPQDTAQSPQLTDQQRDELLHVWNPDQNFYTGLRQALTADGDFTPERIKPLVDLRSGLMRQAQRYADLQAENLLARVQAMVQPLQQHYARAEAQRHEESFYSAYPELKDHGDIVTAIAAKMRGVKLGKDQDPKQVLAKAVEKAISKINPSFKLTERQETQPATSNGGMPAMAQLSTSQSKSAAAPKGGADTGDLWT